MNSEQKNKSIKSMNNKIIISLAIIIVVLLALFLVTKFLGIPTEIFTLISSLIAIIFSAYMFFRTQKTSMIPVLVFVRVSEKKWQIQNVGKGPAVTVTIADKPDGKWRPLFFSPMAAGASLNLDALETKTDFGAVYTDINGDVYSTRFIKHIHIFSEGNLFPEWEEPTHAHWQLKEYFEDVLHNK